MWLNYVKRDIPTRDELAFAGLLTQESLQLDPVQLYWRLERNRALLAERDNL